MKFIIIHGPPAVGKLTTARHLAQLTDFKVLHNHLTFNIATTLFDVGTPQHIELHRELRLTMLNHAAKSGLRGVIITLVYAEAESLPVIEEIKSICKEHQIELHSVFLTCSEEELHRRVIQPDRTANGKLDSSEKLSMLLTQHNYIPIPNSATFLIDTTSRSPESTSKLIANRVFPDASETTIT